MKEDKLEYVTEEDVRNLIKSENVSHQLTENGFSLAVGFDESDLPHGKCRSMIGNKSIIDVMDDVLVERLKLGEDHIKLKEFLVKRISELDKRISTWSNFTQSGQQSYSVLSLRLETYKEILSEFTGVSI